MSDSKHRVRERERPVLTDPPFLCGACHHGRMIVQKLQPWLLAKESWQDGGPRWYWQARCSSSKVSPWKFTIFSHPVVDCDAYRTRKVLTTEDLARKAAKKAKQAARAQKRRKKRRERKGRK